jgi:hypothetical protein
LADWLFLPLWLVITGWAAIFTTYNLRHLSDGVTPGRRWLAWAMRLSSSYGRLSPKQIKTVLQIEVVMTPVGVVALIAKGV